MRLGINPKKENFMLRGLPFRDLNRPTGSGLSATRLICSNISRRERPTRRVVLLLISSSSPATGIERRQVEELPIRAARPRIHLS